MKVILSPSWLYGKFILNFSIRFVLRFPFADRRGMRLRKQRYFINTDNTFKYLQSQTDFKFFLEKACLFKNR